MGVGFRIFPNFGFQGDIRHGKESGSYYFTIRYIWVVPKIGSHFAGPEYEVR